MAILIENVLKIRKNQMLVDSLYKYIYIAYISYILISRYADFVWNNFFENE